MAEVAREHGWYPPKSLDSDENFKPKHTLFCRQLRFVAIYALFGDFWSKKVPFWVKNSVFWARSALLHGIYCIFHISYFIFHIAYFIFFWIRGSQKGGWGVGGPTRLGARDCYCLRIKKSNLQILGKPTSEIPGPL